MARSYCDGIGWGGQPRLVRLARLELPRYARQPQADPTAPTPGPTALVVENVYILRRNAADGGRNSSCLCTRTACAKQTLVAQPSPSLPQS